MFPRYETKNIKLWKIKKYEFEKNKKSFRYIKLKIKNKKIEKIKKNSKYFKFLNYSSFFAL